MLSHARKVQANTIDISGSLSVSTITAVSSATVTNETISSLTMNGSISNALTGLSASAGTIASSDTLLQAFSKISNSRIVQVVISSEVTNNNTTSSTFQNTLSGTITPKLATNYIRVIAHGILDSDTAGNAAYATISRGATNLTGNPGMCQAYSASGGQINTNCTMEYWDSPLTTSATTYYVQLRSQDGIHNVEFGNAAFNIMQRILSLAVVGTQLRPSAKTLGHDR
jgi:hypothetical protein